MILLYSCLGLAVVELAADGLLQHNSTVKEIGRKIVSHRREDDAFSSVSGSVHTVLYARVCSGLFSKEI